MCGSKVRKVSRAPEVLVPSHGAHSFVPPTRAIRSTRSIHFLSQFFYVLSVFFYTDPLVYFSRGSYLGASRPLSSVQVSTKSALRTPRRLARAPDPTTAMQTTPPITAVSGRRTPPAILQSSPLCMMSLSSRPTVAHPRYRSNKGGPPTFTILVSGVPDAGVPS